MPRKDIEKGGNGQSGSTGSRTSSSGGSGEGYTSLTKSRLRGVPAKLGQNGPLVLWAAATAFVVFAVFFVSLVPQQIKLRAGEVSPVNVKAPQEVIDDAATERLKAQKAAQVAEIWEVDPTVLSEIKRQIETLRETISQLSSSTETSTQEILQKIRPYLDPKIPDADILGIVAASPKSVDLAFSRLTAIIEDLLSEGVKPDNLAKAKEEVFASIAKDSEISDQMARFLSSFVAKNLKPNLIFNREETERKVKEAVSSIEPVRIRRGQFIVREGDIVTEDQIKILEKLGMIGSPVRFSTISGSILMSLLITGFLGVYLRAFYPDITAPKKASMAACVVMVSIVTVKGLSAVSLFLSPVPAGVMLATTLFDRRFGVLLGVSLSLATGVITGFDLRPVALSLVGSLAAAAAIRTDWSRSQIIRAGFLVSLVSGISYVSLGLTGAIPLNDILTWRDTLLVLLNGPMSAILAVGSLPLFESVFGIITPIKLIELSNPEHPLLHRLLLEAPGTYHHSIMVGNLAEAAAWAIGADSLLARVGAYYHDIGKVKRPYFFSENQMPGAENPHDKMSPALSATVIMSHVKDGLELAKEHKVPQIIRDFIAEHHGTTLVAYFYNRAYTETQDAGRGPDEWDYRYEGPRPGTKETAIVMLADSIEAAARSLSKPTPARIESVVRKIIYERLTDHQLDRSDLTLRELDVIADTFTRVLTGIFHTRIEYPDKAAK